MLYSRGSYLMNPTSYKTSSDSDGGQPPISFYHMTVEGNNMTGQLITSGITEIPCGLQEIINEIKQFDQATDDDFVSFLNNI